MSINLEMVFRRKWSRANVKSCPSCQGSQLQLYFWYTDDLKFKCRTCKHKFEIRMNIDDTESAHITYWEVIYATTQSAALKQKAADILKGNGIPLPERKE